MVLALVTTLVAVAALSGPAGEVTGEAQKYIVMSANYRGTSYCTVVAQRLDDNDRICFNYPVEYPVTIGDVVLVRKHSVLKFTIVRGENGEFRQ